MAPAVATEKASYTVEFPGKDGGLVAVPVTVTTRVYAGVPGDVLPVNLNLGGSGGGGGS